MTDITKYGRFVGGGCSCGNAPNCGHFSDIGGFAMRAKIAKANPSKKTKKEKGRKGAPRPQQAQSTAPKKRR